MLAHEVETLCTVLSNVYSRTCLPICIEIGSYFADTEQKNSWHVLYTVWCELTSQLSIYLMCFRNRLGWHWLQFPGWRRRPGVPGSRLGHSWSSCSRIQRRVDRNCVHRSFQQQTTEQCRTECRQRTHELRSPNGHFYKMLFLLISYNATYFPIISSSNIFTVMKILLPLDAMLSALVILPEFCPSVVDCVDVVNLPHHKIV